MILWFPGRTVKYEDNFVDSKIGFTLKTVHVYDKCKKEIKCKLSTLQIQKKDNHDIQG